MSPPAKHIVRSFPLLPLLSYYYKQFAILDWFTISSGCDFDTKRKTEILTQLLRKHFHSLFVCLRCPSHLHKMTCFSFFLPSPFNFLSKPLHTYTTPTTIIIIINFFKASSVFLNPTKKKKQHDDHNAFNSDTTPSTILATNKLNFDDSPSQTTPLFFFHEFFIKLTCKWQSSSSLSHQSRWISLTTLHSCYCYPLSRCFSTSYSLTYLHKETINKKSYYSRRTNCKYWRTDKPKSSKTISKSLFSFIQSRQKLSLPPLHSEWPYQSDKINDYNSKHSEIHIKQGILHNLHCLDEPHNLRGALRPNYQTQQHAFNTHLKIIKFNLLRNFSLLSPPQ